MIEIPTLETERLLLRPQVMADWPAYASLMMSGRAAHMGGPHTLAGAWGLFCQDFAQWGLMGHGALMIEDRATGLCLGQVGINSGPLFPEHELGWLVYPAAEGKGYAFEAARAMHDWAFGARGLETLVSYIGPDNLRSRRLAERLGAELDATASRLDPADLVYRHKR